MDQSDCGIMDETGESILFGSEQASPNVAFSNNQQYFSEKVKLQGTTPLQCIVLPFKNVIIFLQNLFGTIHFQLDELESLSKYRNPQQIPAVNSPLGNNMQV